VAQLSTLGVATHFMKIRITLLVFLVCTGGLFASNGLYNDSVTPKLPLDLAYDIAVSSLGQATNEFHCVGASLASHFSNDGEWLFDFHSTNAMAKWNATEKWVTVEFDGKTHIESVVDRD